MRDTFEVRTRVPEPAARVWAKLTDLDRHTATIPFTRVTPVGEHMRTGLRFVGDTRLGPLGFADRMVVTRADAPTGSRPGRLEVEKYGPIAGHVDAVVEQMATGTLVTWRQSLRPAWLPVALRPLGALAGRMSYGMGLRRLLR